MRLAKGSWQVIVTGGEPKGDIPFTPSLPVTALKRLPAIRTWNQTKHNVTLMHTTTLHQLCLVQAFSRDGCSAANLMLLCVCLWAEYKHQSVVPPAESMGAVLAWVSQNKPEVTWGATLVLPPENFCCDCCLLQHLLGTHAWWSLCAVWKLLSAHYCTCTSIVLNFSSVLWRYFIFFSFL